MQADEPGFLPGKTRNKDELGLKNVAFYYDDIHPDGRTGARYVCMLIAGAGCWVERGCVAIRDHDHGHDHGQDPGQDRPALKTVASHSW